MIVGAWRRVAPRVLAHAALVDASLLVAAKLAIGAFVLACGFHQVSDDDYSRTVIAEQFAHAPRLDPSGTSWLPLPFWVAGTVMIAAGRSLGVARGIAVALGAISVAAPYAALRSIGVGRTSAVASTAIAMALPWNAWLAVAPVPEAWEGAIGAAGVLAMGLPAFQPWCALALLAASLSRYEAWPACAVLAVACVVSRARPVTGARCGALALAGPLAWMAWNAYAHGSPTHFVARVTAFRRAIGAADIPLADKLLDYPRALAFETLEVAILGVIGVGAACAAAALRRRWAWPIAGSLAILVFLVAGDVRDGAPTHHPERALSIIWWVLVAIGVDAIAAAVRATRGAGRVAAGLAVGVGALSWCASLPPRWREVPGNGDAERRDAQIAAGLELRARNVTSAEVTPCAYEHFALLAAWGAPERARIGPIQHTAVTAACPRVEVGPPPLEARDRTGSR